MTETILSKLGDTTPTDCPPTLAEWKAQRAATRDVHVVRNQPTGGGSEAA